MTFIPTPICIFLDPVEGRYHRTVHCLECGLPFVEMTGEVRTVIDNNSYDVKEMKSEGFKLGMEIRCKRCKTPYKIYF